LGVRSSWNRDGDRSEGKVDMGVQSTRCIIRLLRAARRPIDSCIHPST
jgi:hypothetical protein